MNSRGYVWIVSQGTAHAFRGDSSRACCGAAKPVDGEAGSRRGSMPVCHQCRDVERGSPKRFESPNVKVCADPRPDMRRNTPRCRNCGFLIEPLMPGWRHIVEGELDR